MGESLVVTIGLSVVLFIDLGRPYYRGGLDFLCFTLVCTYLVLCEGIPVFGNAITNYILFQQLSLKNNEQVRQTKDLSIVVYFFFQILVATVCDCNQSYLRYKALV